MASDRKLVIIEDVLIFPKDNALVTRELSPYIVPKKKVSPAEIGVTPIPKKKSDAFSTEYDFSRVINTGKNGYSTKELIHWYKVLTGRKLPVGILRERLVELHKVLDINAGFI